MSVGPTRGPVQRPSDDRDFTEIFQRLEDLERAAAFIRFLVDNEGGWLYVQFNTCLDLDEFPDPLAVGGTWGGVLVDASGCGFLVGSTKLLLLKGEDVTSEVNTGKTWIVQGPGGTLQRMVDGDTDLHLPTGGNIIFDN